MEELQEKIVLLLMDGDVNESGSENYIDTARKITSLISKTNGGAQVPCSGGLVALTPHEHNCIRQALALMNSMILSGEQHSPTSKEKFNAAMEILWGSGN